MSDLTLGEKEELAIEIEKILTIKGVNTYATDLIPLIETFYKNRALLANGENEKNEKALSMQNVSGLLPTSEEVKAEFRVDSHWASEDKAHAIGKRQGAFWVINKVLRNNR